MYKENKYVRYDKILTDNEILLYALMIDQFKNGEIDFHTLKRLFLNNGVIIEPILRGFSKNMMTTSHDDIIKKFIKTQDFSYSDVDYFVLNSEDFINVIFRMDYKAIELLANYGIPKYQKAMISILLEQLGRSLPKNEKIKLKREKWRRRINELRLLLKEEEKIEKTK